MVGIGCINSSCFSLKRIVVLPAPSNPKVTTRISIFGPMWTRLSWVKDGRISLIRMTTCRFFFRLGFLNCLKWLCFSPGIHQTTFQSLHPIMKIIGKQAKKQAFLVNLEMPVSIYSHLSSIYSSKYKKKKKNHEFLHHITFYKLN